MFFLGTESTRMYKTGLQKTDLSTPIATEYEFVFFPFSPKVFFSNPLGMSFLALAAATSLGSTT